MSSEATPGTPSEAGSTAATPGTVGQLKISKVTSRATSATELEKPIITTTGAASDSSEDPPSPISSENLLRRPSFKKILEDLSSSAETTLNKGDPLASAAAATLQAQAQQAVLQQAGLTNPALLPTILQGLQQQTSGSGSSTNTEAMHLAAAMMNAQSNALLNSTTHANQSPLIAGAATLAGQNNLQLPVNLLSSALLNAASNNAITNQLAQLTGSASLNSTGMVKSPGDPSQVGGEETGRKREVRLMKNREAARECRRKKKEYIRCLENRVAVLESQNQALIGELRALKELYLPKNQE